MNVSLVCFHLSLAKSHFSVHLVMWLLVHLSIVTFDANGHSLQVETTAPSSIPFNSAPSLIFLNQTEDNSTEQYDQPPWAETFKSLQINNLSQGFQVDSLEINPAHLPLVSVGSNHDEVGEVVKTHKKLGGGRSH